MKKARGNFNNDLPGKLFIVEGCDGSGKSTQLFLLKKWLESKGYFVFFTEWNSSELLKKYTKKAKRKNLLTPTTFSLIHASDFADRYEKLMLPHLRAGHLVLADRYIYTAYARDIARGCDPEWLKNLYKFATKPTVAFYFQAPLEVSLSRILTGRDEIKYHEAGMDLGLSKDPVESFKQHVWINPFWEDDVREVVAQVGPERVIFGSDWPHIEGMPQPLDYVRDVAHFDAATQRKILRDNTLELNTLRPA
jgi:dTMP kinase